MPRRTTVYSSKSGFCPGSTHPAGLRMWAILTASVFELTRPTYSSIAFGLLPAATMRVGFAMSSGMDPRHGRHTREHRRLVPCELGEPGADVGAVRDRLGERQVRRVMARLAREETAVERAEIVLCERLRQETQALAAARLDERETEQRVEEARRLVRAHRRHQPLGVRARDETPEAEAPLRERGQDLLEVEQLLAREPGERREQGLLLGIAEEEADRRGRRLLLAVGVVDEHLVERRDGTRPPAGNRR